MLMQTLFKKTKSPNSDLDYSIDWSRWLGDDVVVSSAWTIPTELAGHDDSIDNSGKITMIWISGGIARSEPYVVSNKIVAESGRIEEASISFYVVKQ